MHEIFNLSFSNIYKLVFKIFYSATGFLTIRELKVDVNGFASQLDHQETTKKAVKSFMLLLMLCNFKSENVYVYKFKISCR